MYNRILITGGCGFIGSHVTETIIDYFPNSEIRILDKLTYAADERNLKERYNDYELIVGDIRDPETCWYATAGIDLLIHLAAESHVDNSFNHSIEFTKTNVLGTHNLLEACKKNNIYKIIHVSTDEVYGEVLEKEVDETAILNPTNPYSASKAGAEMLVQSYISCYKLPAIIIRANNIFGTRQFPEKLIPCCIMSLINNKKIPIHGTGQNIRHYLSVQDFSRAIIAVIEKGQIGEIYNVGSTEEYKNVDVITMICKEMGKPFKESIEFVPDRPFNDFRYAIQSNRIRSLGWNIQNSLLSELKDIIEWYRSNQRRYQ